MLANDYPRQIRPTLRDAVCYLRVELLANTSSWRPEHENEIYQLDLEQLLGAKTMGYVDLTDPAVHPLRKLAQILDDLERWHGSKGRKEAAFEARLTRLRLLHGSFSQATDRARLRKDLRQRLGEMRKHKWWAMGMSLLAEFVRDEQAPDNLIRARKIARQGHKAYPKSIGGQRCLHIAESIEKPDYRLEAMASDAPDRASVGVMHKSLNKIYFRAFSMDLKAMIESARDYNLFPRSRKLERLVDTRKPTHSWQIDLPKTPDFKLHRTLVTPPMKQPGLYVVVSSARKDFGRDNNHLRATYVVLGDLVLVTRRQRGEVQVDVLSGKSGAPVPGVKVSLYKYDYRQGHRAADSRITPRSGSVSFRRKDSSSYFLLAEKGKQIAIDPDYLYMYGYRDPGRRYATLIYTDRSIYRPNQTLHYKAVLYRHDKRSQQLAPRTRLTLSLRDANHQEVAKQTVTTNAYGTASGEFLIPAGRLLGRWQLRSSRSGSSVISVEEYKRPTFEAKIKDPTTPLRLNKKATLVGEARYYFGLPVTSGKVKWRVTRTPVYPWWWGYYSWYRGSSSGSRVQTIDAGTARLKEDGSFSITFVPAADERLAAESKDLTYRYSLSADVTDEGGETRSASRSFRLGFVAVEASVSMEKNFIREGKPAKLTVVRSNLDGVPAAGKGSYRIVSLRSPKRTLLPADQPLPQPPGKKKPKAYLTQGDRKRTRWNPGYQPKAILYQWGDSKERARGKLKHDKKGKAVVKLPALPAGAYRLRYTTKDAFGATYKMSQEFLVAGKQTALKLPAFLRLERASVKVGQTARLYVASGLDSQPILVDIYRDQKRTERRLLTSGKDATLIEIPVTEAQRGGFGVTVSVLRDHQFMHFSRSIFVPWDNKELQVSFSTFRDKLRPGAKETWTVKVSGPAGAKTPVRAAEVLAYMYDRSLDAFAAHHPPSPLSIFPNFSGAVSARTSLGQARQSHLRSHGFGSLPHYPHLRADQLRFYSGYGIGGPGRRGRYRGVIGSGAAMPRTSMQRKRAAKPAAAPAKLAESKSELALAQPADAEGEERGKKRYDFADDDLGAAATPAPAKPVQVRSDFSETAFFKPHLLTGKDGSVSFEFSVPDSVTSWNVWAHAITRDLQRSRWWSTTPRTRSCRAS
jgi:5-hydroxyisourate hydrolase-like protein (transthyretin family)